MNEPMRIAIYVQKISKKDQRLFPEKNQLKEIRNYLKTYNTFEIADIYKDDFSKTGKLPNLDKLLAEAEKGKFNVVVTDSAERFGKDVISAYQYARIFFRK